MKKFLIVGLLGVMGAIFMAATCTVVNVRLTTIDGKDVFAGELKNDSGVNILNHKFRVAFLDSSNNVVETKTVEGCVRSVKSGESDYFSVRASASASSTSTGLARLANLAEDSTFKVGDQADSDITISDISIRRDDDNVRVTGKIKNNSNDELFSPNVCVVIWDDAGKVVIVQRDESLSDLDEDESDTFDISIDVTDIDDIDNAIDSVDIAADGLDGSSSGKPVKPEWDRDNSVTDCGDATNTPTKTNTPTNTTTPPATPTETSTSTPTSTGTVTPANTASPTKTPCTA